MTSITDVNQALSYLGLEWRRLQAERSAWEQDKLRMEGRIASLEAELALLKSFTQGATKPLVSSKDVENQPPTAGPKSPLIWSHKGGRSADDASRHCLVKGSTKSLYYRTLPSSLLSAMKMKADAELAVVEDIAKPAESGSKEFMLTSLSGKGLGSKTKTLLAGSISSSSTPVSSISSSSSSSPSPAPLPSSFTAELLSPKVVAGEPSKSSAEGRSLGSTAVAGSATVMAAASAAALMSGTKGTVKNMGTLTMNAFNPFASLEKTYKRRYKLRAHMDSVRAFKFHATAPLALSGSDDGTAKLWDISGCVNGAGAVSAPGSHTKRKQADTTLEPVHTFWGHNGLVTSVCFQEKFQTVVTAGVDGKAMIWSLPAETQVFDQFSSFGRAIPWRECVLVHGEAVWSTCVHPQERLLFTASADGTLTTWSLPHTSSSATASPKRTHRSPLDYVGGTPSYRVPTSVCVQANDQRKLVVGYDSGEVALLDIETGKTIALLKDKGGDAATGANANLFKGGKKDKFTNPLAVHVQSHTCLSVAVSCHADKCVRFWDWEQGSMINSLLAHQNVVTSCSFDSTGLYLATSSHDQTVRLWDFSTRRIIQELASTETHRSKFDEAVFCVNFHPSTPLLASGGADSFVNVYI